MVPEEYVVSLVMEGDGSPPTELRIVGEEGCQHTTHGVAKAGIEVIQYHLWKMCCCLASFLKQTEIKYFKT